MSRRFPQGDLRQGRHNKRLVYRQVFTDGPDDSDPLYAVFFHEDEAAEMVLMINGLLASLREPEEEEA